MRTNKKSIRTAIVLVLTVALAVSLAVPALADDITPGQEQTQVYSYEAPTAPVTPDAGIVTGSAHRAASPMLGMLGVNALSGFGMINGGAPADLATARNSAALGVWGSSLNANPDPYYWNYFYNYYAAANGLETVSDALINANVAASPVMADSTLLEEYGNISVSISTRPDILVGCASRNGSADTDGYNDQLATINAFTPDSPFYKPGDETYSPKLVSYQTTTLKNMIWSVHQFANAITAVMNETGKTVRYEDPQTIAKNYEEYIYGLIAYVNEQLNARGLQQKTVAVVTAINEDGTYTIGDENATSATSILRAFEYTETVSKNLADIYGTIVTVAQLQEADVIVTINNTNIDKNALEESFGESAYKGIMITNTPATLYGVTMNSVENAMGLAYVVGSMYCDILDLNPVELCAYFYQKFLHISDLDSLATVVKTNFAQTILPNGVSATLPADYSEAKIAAKINEGMSYYAANPEKFCGVEFMKIGMGLRYSDVAANQWFYDAVEYVSENGYFKGIGNNRFDPSSTMNMASLLQLLSRIAGNEDAAGEYWWTAAENWAIENKLIAADEFDPYAPVTRERFFCMFHDTIALVGTYDMNVKADITGATDYDKLDPANIDAIAWIVGAKLIEGVSADSLTIDPAREINRAEIATMLMRYYTNVG